MSSGVQVQDACVQAFEALKLNKKFKEQKLRFLVYKISDDKRNIEIDRVQEKTSGDSKTYYDTFLGYVTSDIPKNPRYIIIDFEFTTDDGRPQNKVVFINWCPDNAGVKDKMLYASSKDAIKQKLNGIAKEHQGTELSEMEYAAVLERCKS